MPPSTAVPSSAPTSYAISETAEAEPALAGGAEEMTRSFEMVSALDSLGWRKYPVWIHEDRHSHAAIIVRMEKETFREGHVVLKHWLIEEFLV